MAIFKGILAFGFSKSYYKETFYSREYLPVERGYGQGYGQQYGGMYQAGTYIPIGETGILLRVQHPTDFGYGESYGQNYGSWRLFQYPRNYAIGYGRYYGKWYGDGADSLLEQDTQPLIHLFTEMIATFVSDSLPITMVAAETVDGVEPQRFDWAKEEPLLLTKSASMYQTWKGFGIKPED